MTKILIPIILVLVVLGFILIKEKSPQKQENPTKEKASTVKTAEQVLALGGICSTVPITDGVNDAEGAKAGATKNIVAPDKAQFDTRRIILGRDGNFLVVHWEFGSQIPVDNHHTISLNFEQAVQGENDKASFSIRWTAAEQRWTGHYTAAGAWDSVKKDFKEGSQKQFDPNVQITDNAIQLRIPIEYFVPNVNHLTFYSQVLAKQENTSYVDMVSGVLNCP